MVVFGTRPEAIKLAPVIQRLKESPVLQCVTVSTGQHKETLQHVLSPFKLNSSVDFNLDLMTANQTLTHLSAMLLEEMEHILSIVEPHLVLVQGDTTTAYMAGLAAFYRKIPVGHVEAGLRTFDIHSPFPEEINRQGLSSIATFHFAPTARALDNLQASGHRLRYAYLTGNTVVDALYSVLGSTRSAYVQSLLDQANALVGPSRNATILLLTAHRRENHGRPLRNFLSALKRVVEGHESVVVIFPVHLNPNIRSAVDEALPRALRTVVPYSRILVTEPLDFQDLVHIMNASHHVLTDSGGIQEEVTALGRPVLVLRTTTERMDGVLAGVSKLVGVEEGTVYESSARLLADTGVYKLMSRASQLYGNGTAAKQIVKVIESHADGLYNRTVVGRQTSESAVTAQAQEKKYEWVIVLTVWRRATLERQLQMLKDQTLIQAAGAMGKPFKVGVRGSRVSLSFVNVPGQVVYHYRVWNDFVSLSTFLPLTVATATNLQLLIATPCRYSSSRTAGSPTPPM